MSRGEDSEGAIEMKRFRMAVEGMTCDDCNIHVSRALEGAGARDVSADWTEGEARFTLEHDVDRAELAAAVAKAGYRSGAIAETAGPDAPVSEAEPVRPPVEAPVAAVADRVTAGYDLVVLGAGSAAFAAAIKARDLGATVALVEHGTIGGTCVNVGCVPSKALLRAGEVFHQAGHHGFAGIETLAERVGLAELVTHKDELVGTMRREKYVDLVEEYGFEVIHGHATFTGPATLEVDGRELRGGAYLVATGASPQAPPIDGLDEAGYLTSTTALELKEVPGSLAVIGANAIGLELGQLFLHLDSRVTFFDVLDRIAPFEEPEVSELLAEILVSEGAETHTPAGIVRVTGGPEGRILHAEVDGETRTFEVDEVLVATGRRPNTDGLGLDAAGVTVDEHGAVIVDDRLQTANPRVFAAGDVTSAPQFVYVAAYEGALAAEHALKGTGRSVDLSALPRVTFTSPQIASVGLTEAQARELDRPVKTSIVPLSVVPRALVNRDTRGLIKMVADERDDRLLGVSILAESAGEVIQAAVVALRHRATVADIASTFHPYLTMAEGLKLTAQGFTRDVAKLSCCAA